MASVSPSAVSVTRHVVVAQCMFARSFIFGVIAGSVIAVRRVE